ncbi:hypothetical protein [Draconibacterium halophilum]|uniref:tRNA (Guanine-N1)-methyltransferase n=1 Tax=Draconibacterium halophilum TaxID=2706887 RepID=A0A6C0RDW2_9BACT|nr:hypothetical protein [Draconibacterium halophilum]QIA07331.1 hypothetical protein G0Q07_06145 [Draconibacterium halophilum]
MKKIFALVVLVLVVSGSFAQKDINAWKQEQSLPNQYEVFKKNLNFWNGSYFLEEDQLDDFYEALTDTIGLLENNVDQKNSQIRNLNSELSTRDEQMSTLQQQLDESLKLQNSIVFLGMPINKNAYSVTMYLLIAGVLVLAGFVFLLYKRSLAVTHRTKKDYDELKEEYEVHKKNALERYTKINMELHQTRLEQKRGSIKS